MVLARGPAPTGCRVQKGASSSHSNPGATPGALPLPAPVWTAGGGRGATPMGHELLHVFPKARTEFSQLLRLCFSIDWGLTSDELLLMVSPSSNLYPYSPRSFLSSRSSTRKRHQPASSAHMAQLTA